LNFVELAGIFSCVTIAKTNKTYKQIQVSENALVCDNTGDIARLRVDDGQAVHLVLGEYLHGVEQSVLGLQVDEGPAVLFEHLAPRLDLVLFQLFDFFLSFEIQESSFKLLLFWWDLSEK
jgi:hypothetical protein